MPTRLPARSPTPTSVLIGRLLNVALIGSLIGVCGLAVALSLGMADPPRAGPRRWESRFEPAGVNGPAWQVVAPPGGTASTGPAGLVFDVAGRQPTRSAYSMMALTPGLEGDYTFEVAGAGDAGSAPAYGLVFAWLDAEHYGALLVNGHGYAEAYRQAGPTREKWFEWQQWPHILLGGEANRLRVDWRGGRASLRINDEVLVAGVPAEAGGQLGVLARFGPEPGRVVFGWAQLWAP